MSEQLNLFETASKRWVERLWERVGAEPREAAIAVLAQMAKARLEEVSSPRTKDTGDES